MDDITITEKIHLSLTLKCHFIVDEHESNTSKFVATYHLNEKLSLKINMFFLMIMFTVHIMLIHWKKYFIVMTDQKTYNKYGNMPCQ